MAERSTASSEQTTELGRHTFSSHGKARNMGRRVPNTVVQDRGHCAPSTVPDLPPGFDSMPRIEESLQVEYEGRELRSNVWRGIENKWKEDGERQKGIDEEARNAISLSGFSSGNQTPNESLRHHSNMPYRSHKQNSSAGNGDSAA